MIKEVNYYPQYLVEETQFNENYAVISITDSHKEENGIAKIEGTTTILRVNFLDVEEEIKNMNYSHFTRELGEKIIYFVNDLQKQEKEFNLVVHCRMGASRSPAVALYVHKLTQCEFPGYDVANKPNQMVLKVLEDLSGLKIDIPEKKENDSLLLLIPKIKIK